MAKDGEKFNLSGFVQNSDGTYSKVKTVLQPREIKQIKGKKSHEEVLKEISFVKQYPLKSNEVYLPEDMLVFEWCDKHVSLNQWYSSKHWTHRNKIANEWHDFYKKFLCSPYPIYNEYRVIMEYNSRLDPSNTIPMIKLLEDALQELNIIKDDTMEYCKGITITPNELMKKKSYKISIVKIK